MYHANHISGELLYLWLLLTVVLSPKSYEDLRTIIGTVYDTVNRACVALGLLEDNWKWIECFNEVVVFTCHCSQHCLLVMALAYGAISHPMGIGERFHDHFYDDITLRQHKQLNCLATLENLQYDYGLYLTGQQLQSMNKRLTDFHLEKVIHHWVDDERFPQTAHIRNFNRDKEGQQYEGMAETINNNQRAVFQNIT
jgi:hypothetical protein